MPGFSLVEIVLVVGMLSAMLSVSMPMLRKYQIRADLLNASETITQGMARARLLAQSGSEGSSWGFSVEHGVLFKGDSYDARDPVADESYPLPSTIAVSGTTEVYFDALTGKPNAPGSIVTLVGNDGIERIVDLELTVGGFIVNQNDLITVCSQPGTSGQKLRLIQDSELQYYLSQGAIQGSCPVLSSSSASSSSVASSSRSSVAAASSSAALPAAVTTKGLFVLQGSSSAALGVSGNAILTSNNGAVRVNSNNASAVTVTSNGKIYASGLYITGNPGRSVTGNGTISGTVYPGTAAAADPLAALAVPSQYSPQMSAVSVSGNAKVTLSSNKTYQSISVSGNGELTLTSGAYYLNGGLTVTGNGKLYGTNVFIYNAAGDLVFDGNAIVQLTPPSTGTYNGVLLFNNRTAASAFTMNGNAQLSLAGAVYAPNATFTIDGNGINNAVGSLLIAKKLTMTGNAKLNVQ